MVNQIDIVFLKAPSGEDIHEIVLCKEFQPHSKTRKCLGEEEKKILISRKKYLSHFALLILG